MPHPSPDLRHYLESHYRAFDYARYRQRDPVRFVEPYRGDPRAVEVAGFLAASIAYGQVGIILANLRALFERIGEPLAYLRSFDPARAVRDLAGFKHRFNDGRDVAFLMQGLAAILERHGSLEAVVRGALTGSDADLSPGLAALAGQLAATDARVIFGSAGRPASTRFLFSSPADGSTCKRMWMFDDVCPVDFGAWPSLAPRLLLLPLDTHTSRLVKYLGLVRKRRSLGLEMAREATRALARLDPEDPVKYDFALAHIGISGQCAHRRVAEICSVCPLDPVCRLPVGAARPRAGSGRSSSARRPRSARGPRSRRASR
jgi:uncharacterized protein (TIGR02757 family)